MDRSTFDKKRDTWRKGVTNSKALAAQLANAALAHFAEHGDTSYIADFYSDISTAGKNYVRKAAFLQWLVAHAPVKMEQNKFVKDQELATKLNWSDDYARNALVAKAEEKAFYDFAPEAEIVNFKADSVVVALENVIARFRNSKHYKAEDSDAAAMVDRAEGLVKHLRGPAQAA